MVVAAINSNKKCTFAEIMSDLLLQEQYMVETCNTSRLEVKTQEERLKENFLMSVLLENISFLNYRDCNDKKIVNCDLNKIAHLK